ncbi:MAG TPA: hypothetical protein VIL70_01690, partial [Chthoniobacterales bacterium]
VAGPAVDAFCAVRSLEDAILTKTAIKNMAFIIGGAIFDGLTQRKNQLRLAQPVKSSGYSSDEGDYFVVLLEEAHHAPPALSLAMTQIRSERAVTRDGTLAQPMLFSTHSRRKNAGFAPALVVKAHKNHRLIRVSRSRRRIHGFTRENQSEIAMDPLRMVAHENAQIHLLFAHYSSTVGAENGLFAPICEPALACLERLSFFELPSGPSSGRKASFDRPR